MDAESLSEAAFRIEKVAANGSLQALYGPVDELERRFLRLRDVLDRQGGARRFLITGCVY